MLREQDKIHRKIPGSSWNSNQLNTSQMFLLLAKLLRPLAEECQECKLSYCLSQIVSGYTHVSPCGNTSLIDLALTTSPSQIKHCAIIPPLANSDHNGLKLEIEWKDTSSRTYSRRRTIWRYAHADFNKACDLILETDWKAIILPFFNGV